MTTNDASMTPTTTAKPDTAFDIVLNRIKHRLRKTHGWFLETIQDLDEATWSSMPTPTSPSVGWHAWHTARTEDSTQARLSADPSVWLKPLAEGELLPNQLWVIEGCVEQWGLDRSQLGRSEAGIEANCSALLPGKTLILPYVTRVFARVEQVVDAIDEQRLQTNVAAQPGERLAVGADLEPSVAEDLMFLISHTSRHLGMIEALLGSFGMQGSATN